MKNTFLSLSVVYWVIIFTSLYNLANSSTLETKNIWIFFISSLILYAILFVGNHFVKNHDKKVLHKTITSSDRLVYYESRIQYQVVTIIFLILFLVITIFNIGGLADISIYFLWMSAFATVFLFCYRPSTFELTDKHLIWKKGNLKIISPWSEVIAIHHDWEPALVNAPRNFKSTSFFIETKNGMSKCADKTNIKRKGVYTLSSMGDELIAEIKKRSPAVEKTGAVSMFKQTQKLKDVAFLLLAVFLVPAIIIGIYYLVYRPL